MMRRRPAAIIAAIVMLALSGCSGGLLPQPPERQLYRLAPAFTFAGSLPRVAAQLVVATPSAPAGLDTRRIALTRSAVSLDYYADAEWTDRVPFLVRAALVEGFERSRAVAAVGPENLGLHADFVIETAIDEFQASYDSSSASAPGSSNAAPRVVVALNARLVRMPEQRIVAQSVMRAAAAAAGNTLPDIVRAFGEALGAAAKDEVTWAVTNPALSGRR